MKSNYYVPVKLGSWETNFHRIVFALFFLGGLYLALDVSDKFKTNNPEHFKTSSYFSGISGLQMDNADFEWELFKQGIFRMILCYSVHSLSFHCAFKFLSLEAARLTTIATGFLTMIALSSLHTLSLCALFCFVTTGLAYQTKFRAIPWIFTICFILRSETFIDEDSPYPQQALECAMYMYSAVKYLAYLPYSTLLIVLYDDFCNQFEKSMERRKYIQLSSVLHSIARLLFWFFSFEFLLHFIHANAIFNSQAERLEHLNPYQLGAISYWAGQFFHLKYVIIFGLPSVFAQIDGMSPAASPVCPSCITRYPRIWKDFDRGLYTFLKRQVYVPLMKPALPLVLSVLRSLLAMTAVFGIVLAWHGADPKYLRWVCLSGFSQITERIAIGLWTTSTFQQSITIVSRANLRRTIALVTIISFTPGLFGMFYFLSREGVGHLIWKRIVQDGTAGIINSDISLSRNCSGISLMAFTLMAYCFIQLHHDRHRK